MTQKELDLLLKDMTLEEKVGQMIQVTAGMLTDGGLVTGPTGSTNLTKEQLSMVGSILGKTGAEELAVIQREQMAKQPHHIPMLFMYDVINGFQTIFPIPLAQGCTFSPDMVEEAGAIAAAEAAASGLHVTFSPMLDLVRDARWGRVMESTGEDPYLNSEMAKAFVRGYQGRNGELRDKDRVAACLKHFAAYGYPEGGRDYDNVELSERTLREDYLPAYAAAVKEGCRMAMTSFNTLNRIPSSGNKWLMRRVLREEMGFDGVLISDYSAVEEMVSHGFAADAKEAARLAIEAGVDIDMVSNSYCGHLAELVREGEVSESLIDEAVMRILKLKNDLGLFENPCKAADASGEKELILCKAHREAARRIAAASFVLLKNDDQLPLSKASEGRIAFIGPYADNHHIHGSWSFPQDRNRSVTIKQGVEQKGVKNIAFARGCYLMEKDRPTRDGRVRDYDRGQAERWLEEAVELAADSETVVLCLGEHSDQSGEGGSRASIGLPEDQLTLLRRVHEVNPNIVTVLFSGRPLELKEVSQLSKALLMVWMPGTEGGNAVADVLFGDTAPQGKLTMSFPRSAGQVPVYYNHFMTGRPNDLGDRVGFRNGYIDESCFPLYPFGYGLTYTEFSYSPVVLSSTVMDKEHPITAKVTVTNTGSRDAAETVQLYLRDVSASVIRPVRMLKGFCKAALQPGESKEVEFTIKEEMLRFYDIDMNYTSEPGVFEVYIGADSGTQNKAEFRLPGGKADRGR